MTAKSLVTLVLLLPAAASAAEVRLATFDVDATPPVGSMMAYDRVVRQDDLPLRLRGIVLTWGTLPASPPTQAASATAPAQAASATQPIVLCAVDWIGIANEGHDAFRQALAEAAGTSRERVALHTLHQHDAPACDFLAERLLKEAGANDLGRFEGSFARVLRDRAAAAVRAAMSAAQPVSHIGWGAAEVEEVASNRRIFGPDGKVRATRYTATKDPALRAEPIGVIDPRVALVSFFSADKPLAVLSYYACHPQSYYRTGIPNPDFPGIARFIRGQAVPEALHVHFNGAGGNIGAGKFNDGAKPNRVALATKLADGMTRAWEATEKTPLASEDIQWRVQKVTLPPAPHLDERQLRADVAKLATPAVSQGAADDLAWLSRCRGGHQIELAMLSLGDKRILHMPGELFVEYQLAAQQMRSDLKVAMAAYGDYGPGYIGTERAYGEGGYETSQRASRVAPAVETVLLDGVRKLLEAK